MMLIFNSALMLLSYIHDYSVLPFLLFGRTMVHLLEVAKNCWRRWWLLPQLFLTNSQMFKCLKAGLSKLERQEQWACYHELLIIIIT